MSRVISCDRLLFGRSGFPCVSPGHRGGAVYVLDEFALREPNFSPERPFEDSLPLGRKFSFKKPEHVFRICRKSGLLLWHELVLCVSPGP